MAQRVKLQYGITSTQKLLRWIKEMKDAVEMHEDGEISDAFIIHVLDTRASKILAWASQ